MKECPFYRILVKETLSSHWTGWLGGLDIEYQPNGETSLSGKITDQAALYGLLNRLRDMGITLISLNRIEPNIGEMDTSGSDTNRITGGIDV